MASATARRHGISNPLLFAWRRAYREGRLGRRELGGFVPATIVAEPAPREAPTPTRGRMDVVTANGRRVIVEHDVDVEALVRIVRALETLP